MAKVNGNMVDDDNDDLVKPVKKTRAKRTAKLVDKSNNATSVGVLASTLANLNNFVVGFANAPAFKLDDSEAKVIAESLVAVANEVDIEISPLNQAIANAVMTVGLIYGVKYALHKASKEEAQNDGVSTG